MIISWFVFTLTAFYIFKWIDNTFLNKHFTCNYPFYIFYFLTSLFTTLMIPFFLIFDRKNCVNAQRGSVITRQISHLVGIKWEVRGIDILQQQEGCVVVSNHQSSFDILAMFWIWRYVYRMTIIAKKELFYVWPFGISAYLGGIVFIDRGNAKKAQHQLLETSRMISEERTKLLLFPEGTRNTSDQDLLPFKKGAFHMAIACQAPIMPVVISPYYFINNKKRFYERGGRVIITALPMISTKGLTIDDVDKLKEQVRDLMLQKFREVREEILASLPVNYPGLSK